MFKSYYMKRTPLFLIALVYSINSHLQTPDPSFQAGLYIAGTVHSLLAVGEDQIIAGGDFVKVNYQWTGPLVRLNKDGSLDPTFSMAISGRFGAR